MAFGWIAILHGQQIGSFSWMLPFIVGFDAHMHTVLQSWAS